MRNIINSRIRLTAAVVAALGAILVGSNPASATPSTLGFYPSTDTVADKGFHLDVDTYGQGLKTNVANTVGLTYGIGDKEGFFGRSEIGADYLTNSGLSANKRAFFNAKTQIYDNAESKTRVVAGVWGVGQKAIGSPDVLYLLGSKSFDWGRVHVGIAQSLANKATVTAGTKSDRTNLHLGYDRAITSKLSFAADWYSGKNTYSGIQPTLYYAVNDKAAFGLGLMHFNDSAVAPRNQVYACFDYNFNVK